jgi:cobalt-zinc-cadmium efflux system outer membrane protein
MRWRFLLTWPRARSKGVVVHVVFALVVVGPAAVAAEVAPTERLSEAEAVRRALARPAVAAVAEGEAQVARGEAEAAARWANPELGWSREQTLRGPGATTEDYVSLSQAFDLSGGRGLRAEAGARRVRAVASAGETRVLEVAAEARHRFHELLYHQELARAAEAWAHRVEETTATLERRAAAGDVARYDVKRLERERATARSRLRAEGVALDAARQRLAAVMGENGDVAAWTVEGPLLPDVPPGDADELIARLASRPDVRELEDEAAAAEAEARAAGRGWIPEVRVTGGVKTAEAGGERATGFLAGVSLPVPVANRRQGEAAAASARARVAVAKRELLLSEAGGQVRARIRQTILLSEAAQQLRREALATSQEVARTAEAAYFGGEVGILELLDAHRGVYESAVQVVELEAAARRAAIELERLTGGAR